MEPTEPKGRATDHPDPVPARPLPAIHRPRVPFLRVLVGVTVLAGLLYMHPTLRDEIKSATVAALLLSAVSLVAGGLWKNQERGLATGLVLSGMLGAQIGFFIAALSWESVLQYPAPLFGIGVLLLLPPLLGFLGGRYTEEKGALADAALRLAEPRWSVAVLVLCSVSLVFAVGLGSPPPPKPNAGPGVPQPPVPLVAAPQVANSAGWGTLTASFQDMRQIRPTGHNMDRWSPMYGLLLSPEGDAFVGQANFPDMSGVSSNHGYVWTEKGGYQDLNKSYPELRHLEQIIAASSDGSVMHVRYSSTAMSGETIWRKEGGLQTGFGDEASAWLTAHPDPANGPNYDRSFRIHAISGDGETVLLTMGQTLVRWTAKGGFERLPLRTPNITVRAITPDGTAFAGHNGTNAFVWSRDGGEMEIARLAGTGSSVAYGVSADGAVVTGTSGNYLFRWTKRGGLENLGRLPGDSMITVGNAVNIEQRGHTVSRDGGVIVGTAGNIPFLWTKQSGVLPLREVLANCGTPLAGSPIESAVVSADGKRITGITREGPALHRWRLLLR